MFDGWKCTALKLDIILCKCASLFCAVFNFSIQSTSSYNFRQFLFSLVLHIRAHFPRQRYNDREKERAARCRNGGEHLKVANTEKKKTNNSSHNNKINTILFVLLAFFRVFSFSFELLERDCCY